jgi:hypothetical protein
MGEGEVSGHVENREAVSPRKRYQLLWKVGLIVGLGDEGLVRMRAVEQESLEC